MVVVDGGDDGDVGCGDDGDIDSRVTMLILDGYYADN